MDADDIYLVRVTTDDRTFRFWAAATPREQAVDSVLAAVPEGWSACLLDVTLKPETLALANGKIRDVSELRGTLLDMNLLRR